MSEAPLPLFAAAGSLISRSITVPDVSTVTEAPTTTEQPGRSSGITTNVTLGIVTAFVGISVGLLGALGIYLWRRRKNRDGTSNMEEGGASLVQSAGVPDGEFVSM